MRLSVLIVALVLATTQSALAHGGPAGAAGLAVASSYEARIGWVDPASAGVQARVQGGDQRLWLHVPATAVVVVLGDAGEPFLRFSPAGVDINDRAPTTFVARLAPRGALPAVDPKATPRWRRLTSSHSFAWHENRLRPLTSRPRDSGPTRLVAHWRVPLIVDGRSGSVGGSLWFAPSPALTSWLGAGVALLGGAILLALLGDPRWRQRGAVGLATLALAGMLACALGSWLSTPHQTAQTAMAVACGVLLAVLATTLLAVADPSLRLLVALSVAGLAALLGFGFVDAFTRGFVLSWLPATVARMAAGIALVGGLGAIVCAGRELARQVGELQPPPLTRARR